MNVSIRLSLFVVLFCLGCAAPKPFVVDNPYPSRGEVEELEARPVPEVEIKPAGLNVERWELEGPFPDMIGAQPHQPVTPLEELTSAYTGGATVTKQMTCVARELGRFVMANDEHPSDPIEDFILDRCGALTMGYDLTLEKISWPAPDDGVPRTEALLVQNRFDELAEMSRKVGDVGRHATLGAWFGVHEDGRSFAFFASGVPEVEFEPIPMVPEPDSDGHIVLKGRVLGPAHYIAGMINKGEHESVECVADARVKAPRFELRCPFLATDATARFGVVILRRSTSPTSSRVMMQRIWPERGVFDVFISSRHQQIASTMLVDGQVGSAAFPEEFTGMVNVLRKGYDLPPLLHAEAQSASVQRLTPSIYAAEEDAERRRLYRAIRAGWGIAKDQIIGGRSTTRYASVSAPKALLSDLADDPFGRRMLFMEGRGALAFGTIPYGETAFLVLCSYNFLPETTHAQRVKKVHRTINAARKLSGEKKMKRYKDFNALATRLSDEVAAGALEPNASRKEFAEEVMSTLNQSVYTQVWFIHDLDDFWIPEDLVTSSPLNGAFMAAEFQPTDQPHTGYFIVVVYPSSLSERHKRLSESKGKR